MYRKILCPVDGSETSNKGMKEAINLAKDLKAKLRFIHVIDNYFPVFDGTGNYVVVDVKDVLRENAEQVVLKAKGTAKEAGIDADSVFTETLGGQSAEFIVEQAKNWPADLIVMGTHGHRGFNRLVMGSDAESVVRTSPIPVMLVNSTVKKHD